MTDRPCVVEVTALTKRLLAALDDLLLRDFVSYVYRYAPKSVQEVRYWGVAAGGPRAEFDGVCCDDGPVLRLEEYLNRDYDECVFRRQDYAPLRGDAGRMAVYRLGLEALAEYSRWLADDQQPLLWGSVANFIWNVHTCRDIRRWGLWAREVAEVIGEFAVYTCLRVVGPPPWPCQSACFEVTRDGVLRDPVQDASPYAQALREVVDLKDLYWFLCAAQRWRHPGCPVEAADFRLANRRSNPLWPASRLLKALGWVVSGLHYTHYAGCIEELCALLLACPVTLKTA